MLSNSVTGSWQITLPRSVKITVCQKSYSEQIVKYLSLSFGFRFYVGSNGEEDIWYDEAVSNNER